MSRAEYIDGYKLHVQFEDGNAGTVDLTEYVGKNDVFARFDVPGYFRRFKIDNGVISWADGELDIAPETLYLKVTGKNGIIVELEYV